MIVFILILPDRTGNKFVHFFFRKARKQHVPTAKTHLKVGIVLWGCLCHFQRFGIEDVVVFIHEGYNSGVEIGIFDIPQLYVFDGENILYESCQYKVIEDNKLNVDTTFASNYIKNARLSDFATTNVVREKAYEYAIKVLTSKKILSTGLYIYGNFGTGKTYFLSALANEFAQKGIKSIIVFMPDLSRNLKNSMAENLLEGRIELLKNVDVLMLDDLGGEMVSNWLRDEIIAPVIQYRLMNDKPIYISSNLDYNLLRDHFASTNGELDNIKSNRILERIKKMTKRGHFDLEFKE